MFLKSIKANGFKSFAEKINIMLENNITCVVGPNGSGKSNIVDAIRWVLGEQSVKSLRGTSAMSDVIFAGSKSRSGANRAEVTLIFDNNDHYLNSDFNEIEIKRILYRNGESEYFINNSRVRLKDITDLFLDSGAGNDSFNIISQGSIESVVNSKPGDRRVIFESAAGVLKYKKRKEESLRKLEKTRENIEKVNLVIEELKTTIEPLKIQSINAKKYLELKEELKNIEIATITNDVQIINEEYAKLQAEIEENNTQILDLNASSTDESTKLETLKLQNIKLDEVINETNKKLLNITSKFVNLQNEKLMYTERKKYSKDSVDIDKNIINLKEEILELDKAISILDNEMNSLDNKLKKMNHDLSDINEEQSFNKIKRNSINTKYQTNLRDLYNLKSREEVLENNILNDTKMPASVKGIMMNERLKGVYNTIGKLIEIPEKYVIAIDTILGASANFIVVENENVAKKGIEYLKEKKLGRATFFPLNIIKEKHISKEIIEQLKNIPGFLGIASDLVENEAKFDNIIKNQLGNVLIVDTIDSLNVLGKELDYKFRIVSLDGEVLHTGGSLTGGFKNSSNSILKDKLELEKLKGSITSKEKENSDIQKELENYDKTQITLNEKEEELNRNIINLRESINEKINLIQTKKQKQLELNKELDGSKALKDGNVDDKLMILLDEVNEAETTKNITEKKLNDLKEEKNQLISEIEELEHKYRDQNSLYNKLQNNLKNKEIELGKLDIKLDNLLNILNENYNLTYEKAKLSYTLEVESDLARSQVTKLKSEISRLGEVNIFAIEEYERVGTRYDFLVNQKNDLEEASLNLTSVIEEMDTIMIDKFKATFDSISKEFQSVFKKLFKGGNGMLKLTEPDNILETGIEIVAEPPGKKLNSIGLLSGGEKTLTAISLLFAVLNVKPVPFCILDEVEAALDEANVDAFGAYLQEKKANSQFILITHKKRTMEYADTLYGITMQESGVSKIVSVKLENI